MNYWPALLLAVVVQEAAAQSNQSTLSNASAMVADGASMVVAGSLQAVGASGLVVVRGIEASGDASVILIENVASGAQASLRLSGELIKGAALVSGVTLGVVAIASGTLLVSAGKVLAFIPNEIGKALLHHSPVQAAGARR